MNVSANYLLVPAFHTPRLEGWTFSQQILLLAFCFARFSDSSYSFDCASFGGVIVSLQRRV